VQAIYKGMQIFQARGSSRTVLAGGDPTPSARLATQPGRLPWVAAAMGCPETGTPTAAATCRMGGLDRGAVGAGST